MAVTLPGRAARAAIAAALPALLACDCAAAQVGPPPPLPGAAAVIQYREALPGPAGPVATGEGPNRVTPLPPPVAARLVAQGGRDAPLLEKVATASDYGAPPTARGPSDAIPQPAASPPAAELPAPTLSRGLGAAATSAGNDHGLGLLALAMLAIGVGAVVLARRDRSRLARE